MDCIRIVGRRPLRGRIAINGAKNAALPLMAASLLTDQPLILHNVPHLGDIRTLCTLLTQHGVVCGELTQDHTLHLQALKITNTTAPYDIVRKMRASFLVLGPLLARCGHAEVSLPGGCAIGARPVDLHLEALKALGASLELEGGYIRASAPQGLKGGDYTFPIVTVTGTENVLMAATLAQGTTRLMNAAQEPEVTDLAHCLIKMGARIEGVGTKTLVIHGVGSLQGTEHTVIPDRIEAGSYALAAAITGGCLTLEAPKLPFLLSSFLEALKETGVQIHETSEGLDVRGPDVLHPLAITTAPFPGFATDLQAQFMVLMTQAQGHSSFTENIWENRFMHVPELNRMGARITVHGASAWVAGGTPLNGAPVMATDLRASLSLILAGLIAQGETVVHRVYHLDRGYEKVEEKLSRCGAVIERLRA